MDHSFLIELLNYKIKFTYTSKYLIINYLNVKLLIGVDSSFSIIVFTQPQKGEGGKDILKKYNFLTIIWIVIIYMGY